MNPPLVFESSAASGVRSYSQLDVLSLTVCCREISLAPNVPNNFNYHTNVYDKIRRQQGRLRLSPVVVIVSRLLGWVDPPHHLLPQKVASLQTNRQTPPPKPFPINTFWRLPPHLPSVLIL